MTEKKEDHLKYGEGQREEYGEGKDYKPEDKTEGADEVGKNKGFGAGGGAHEKGPSSRTNPDGKPEPDVDKETAKQPADAGDAKEPADDEHPIPAQKPAVPRGAGHEEAEGGLPETQPTTKKQ